MSFSCLTLFDPCEMGIKTLVSDRNQMPLESPLPPSALVASHQQDRLPPGIEGKGDAPDASFRVKAQFLHVGVLRAFECIDPWPAGRRAEPLHNTHLRQQLDANLGRQRKKFRLEFRCELDYPHR